MSDPRADVRFDDIEANRVTMDYGSSIVYSATVANGSSQVGLAVRVSTDKTVELTQDATNVFGKLLTVYPDYCVVQWRGFMKLPSGASATLTIGAPIVGDLDSAAEGYIRVAASAQAAELLVARGIIVDNDDTANVVVYLP